jgi:hypothetical protein
MYEIIRPKKVYDAARYLVTTDLYQAANVELSADWVDYDDGKSTSTIYIHHIH